jgi:hypothetical protein
MKEMGTPYYILNGKPEMENPCERRYRGNNNIKIA